MPVDPKDYLEKEKVYTYRGKGKWRILGYMSSPSLIMVNIDDPGRRLHFGIKGLIAKDFNEIPGETVDGKDIGKLASHHTVSKEGKDIGGSNE